VGALPRRWGLPPRECRSRAGLPPAAGPLPCRAGGNAGRGASTLPRVPRSRRPCLLPGSLAGGRLPPQPGLLINSRLRWPPAPVAVLVLRCSAPAADRRPGPPAPVARPCGSHHCAPAAAGRSPEQRAELGVLGDSSARGEAAKGGCKHTAGKLGVRLGGASGVFSLVSALAVPRGSSVSACSAPERARPPERLCLCAASLRLCFELFGFRGAAAVPGGDAGCLIGSARFQLRQLPALPLSGVETIFSVSLRVPPPNGIA